MSDRLCQDVDARGVATVTLNRPALHNAFDEALIAELTAALQSLEADPAVQAVVLAGAGKSFSAGADLDWMRRVAAYSLDENLADAARLAELLRRLDRLAKPTIALVHGAAYGGGVGLVACCDMALAAETAVFGMTEVRLGLIPSVISPYVVNAIGLRQARRYFLTGETFSALRAHEIGLVHEVAPAAELGAALEALLGAILAGAPDARKAAKELVVLNERRPVEAQLIGETVERIARRRATAEAREGLSAFLDKRPPAWRRG